MFHSTLRSLEESFVPQERQCPLLSRVNLNDAPVLVAPATSCQQIVSSPQDTIFRPFLTFPENGREDFARIRDSQWPLPPISFRVLGCFDSTVGWLVPNFDTTHCLDECWSIHLYHITRRDRLVFPQLHVYVVACVVDHHLMNSRYQYGRNSCGA